MLGHGECRRCLRQIQRGRGYAAAAYNAAATADALPLDGVAAAAPREAALSVVDAAAVQAARARRRPGRPPEPRCVGRFADGVEVLKDGAELRLAFFCLAEVELRLVGADDSAFAALKPQYADVLGRALPGMPPGRGTELALETGGGRMPRSRPVKRLSDGELAELRAQLVGLPDRCRIQQGRPQGTRCSRASRGGSWRIGCAFWGLICCA